MTKKIIANKQNPNGALVDLTAEEETQFQADISIAKTEREQAVADQETKENLKASAKAKLIAGEALTEEEANTIVL